MNNLNKVKKLIINTEYVDGPLQNLTTEWSFKNIKKNKSKIIFVLKYQFEKYFWISINIEQGRRKHCHKLRRRCYH